jgi:uncharacterized membrane protein
VAQDLKAGPLRGSADRLKVEALGLASALGDRAVSSVRAKVEDTASRLADYVADGAGPGLMAAVTGARNLAEGKGPLRSLLGAGMTAVKEKLGGRGGKGGGQGKNLKVTNIVESIDVGVPVELAYNQWTQFADFPSFMKKVESVEQVEEEKLAWKAQVLWSHRTWESTILEQVPDDKIIWRSKGAKGHVDGAVTFHELAPSLTRILVVLEYHPQGLFEHTGNIWRAQGRRVRLELKHFRRHVMSEVLLHPDEVDGWRGVIEDGEVVQDHEAAREQEEQDRAGRAGGQQARAEGAGLEDGGEEYAGDQDAYDEDEAEDGDQTSPPARRRRQPAGREQRSGRSSRAQERPRRAADRAAARGGGAHDYSNAGRQG